VIGNILWLVLAGLWLAIGYVLAGLLAFVLIVTIPFGIASFRLAASSSGLSAGRRPGDAVRASGRCSETSCGSSSSVGSWR
jgi:hypothetical protein